MGENEQVDITLKPVSQPVKLQAVRVLMNRKQISKQLLQFSKLDAKAMRARVERDAKREIMASWLDFCDDLTVSAEDFLLGAIQKAETDEEHAIHFVYKAVVYLKKPIE